MAHAHTCIHPRTHTLTGLRVQGTPLSTCCGQRPLPKGSVGSSVVAGRPRGARLLSSQAQSARAGRGSPFCCGSERPRADSSWGLTPAGAAHVSKASSQRLQACRSRASRERGPHPRGWALPHSGLPPALRRNSAPGSVRPVGRSPGVTRSPGLLKSRRGHELARATCSLRAALSEQGAVLGREPTCDSASPFTKGLHTHVRDPAHTPPRGTSLLRIAGDGRTAWGAEPQGKATDAQPRRAWLRAHVCAPSAAGAARHTAAQLAGHPRATAHREPGWALPAPPRTLLALSCWNIPPPLPCLQGFRFSD